MTMNNDQFAALVTPLGVTFMTSSRPSTVWYPEIQLALEPRTIVVHEGRVRKVQVTAAQEDIGAAWTGTAGWGADG